MSGSADSQDRVNMIPLIDTMFFLILFFMFVTKFTPEEKAIASLLPTDKGQGPSTNSKPTVPPQQVNIAIYPWGMDKGHQPSEYRDQLKGLVDSGAFNQTVAVRIGGDNPLELLGAPLSVPAAGGKPMKDQIDRLHGYVDGALAARELPGSRKDQPMVVVSCFSGLSWKYALLAYDAVRAYEGRKAGTGTLKTNEQLMNAREVSFAPPRIRNYTANELGNELYEIISLR
jgi:biopolymer transport protein ExbD